MYKYFVYYQVMFVTQGYDVVILHVVVTIHYTSLLFLCIPSDAYSLTRVSLYHIVLSIYHIYYSIHYVSIQYHDTTVSQYHVLVVNLHTMYVVASIPLVHYSTVIADPCIHVVYYPSSIQHHIIVIPMSD